MRTDSSVNYWIIAQETRQKSALGHVTVRSAHCHVTKQMEITTRIYNDIYCVRIGRLVWTGGYRIDQSAVLQRVVRAGARAVDDLEALEGFRV